MGKRVGEVGPAHPTGRSAGQTATNSSDGVTQASEAPGEVELLRSFVNTLDVEGGTDRLRTSAAAAGWLAENGWGPGTTLDTAALKQLRRLRAALLALLLANAGHEVGDAGTVSDVLSEVGRTALLRVEGGTGELALVPAASGLNGVMGRLLAALYQATIQGSWPRLKACGNDACRWAYYDHSRNGSRRWCTSQGCGNLMAARAYRSRRAEARS